MIYMIFINSTKIDYCLISFEKIVVNVFCNLKYCWTQPNLLVQNLFKCDINLIRYMYLFDLIVVDISTFEVNSLNDI